MSELNNDYPTCTISFFGDSGVGCNCITIRYVRNEFDPNVPVVMGFSNKKKTEFIEDEDKYVKFDIWNGVGGEKSRSLNKTLIKKSDVCVMVYDITRKQSFDVIKNYWSKEIKNYDKKNMSKK